MTPDGGWGEGYLSKADKCRITHDYTLSAANAFKSLGSPARPFRFVYISGEGADQSESSRFLFGQIKGRTERALMAMEDDGFKVVSVRPSAIIPTPEVRPRHMSHHPVPPLKYHALSTCFTLYTPLYPRSQISRPIHTPLTSSRVNRLELCSLR